MRVSGRLSTLDRAPGIVTLKEHLVYQNAHVTVYDDEVRFVSELDGRYLRIVESEGRPGVACLVTHAGRMALVLVYRYPMKEWEWAIPRGFGAADDPRASILAELMEELGCMPDSLDHLGDVTTNSGLLEGHVKIFHAKWPSSFTAPLDDVEVKSVIWLTVAELHEAIETGLVRDSTTLSAIALAHIRGVRLG